MTTPSPALPQRILMDRSSDQFRPLVLRYVGMVYAAACRQVHWERSAEDVTQAVFASLASPSPSICKSAKISAYLLLRTYREAFKARKLETRELLHQGNAAHWARAVEQESASSAWTCIASQLDGTLARLSTKYRAVIAIHFIENRPINELADAFSLHHDAAQSLCHRAIARLQIGLQVQCADLVSLLRQHGKTDAPPALFARIVGPPPTGSPPAEQPPPHRTQHVDRFATAQP